MPELTPERWRTISELLDRALALEPGDRRAWMESQIADEGLRAEVAEMLAGAEQTSGILDDAAGGYFATMVRENGLADSEQTEVAGRRIGPYAIVREVGRGGMGVVYQAERADGQFEHRVALKLVRPGLADPGIVRRFERERRIVARLEHPAIARILDGGISEDGRPYFAMEFVDGEPLTTYCDDRALSIEARLRLFARACDAVQYAHGRLIVHRDLKPSNIMVTVEGELKLVDFGIAKALSDDEQHGTEFTQPAGRRPLTPAYAAPEQLAGEPVTIATDVYALGLVLYQLTVGRLPFDTRDNAELESATLNTDPEPPSRAATKAPARAEREQGSVALRAAARAMSVHGLARRLSGDLDAIMLMALRKEPPRRYLSVQALREDIESHLDHRPIRARREGGLVRAAKFTRRHRVGVGATVLLAVSMVAGLIATAWQARQKMLESAKARQVTEFVTNLFEGADPAQAQGKEITARELVEQGAARLEQELAGQPELQAEMGLVLGRINDKLGLSEEALRLLDQSLDNLPQAGGDASRKTRADALRAKGAALVHLGRAEEAEPLLHTAAAEHRRLPRFGFDRDLEVAEDLDELSIALHALGRIEDTESTTQEAFDLRLAVLGPDHPRVATSYNNLAVIQREFGKFDEAEANYKKALDIRVSALGRQHPETADTLNNLAALLHYRGRYVEAVPAFEEVAAIYSRLYGERHPRTMTGVNNLAVVLLKLGNFARAEELFDSVLAYWHETESERHPSALITKGSLGLLYQLRGETRRAETTAAAVVEDIGAVLGAQHPVTSIITMRLAATERELGHPSRARDLAQPALEVLEGVYGPDHQHVASAIEELGRIEADLGATDQAETHLRQAVAARTAQYGAEALDTLAARAALASLLRAKGNLDESLRLLTADLAIGRRILPEHHPVLFDLLLERGRTLGAGGHAAEAEPLLNEAVKLAITLYGNDNWRTATAELRRAELLSTTGRTAEAHRLAGQARQVIARELGDDHPLAHAAAALAASTTRQPDVQPSVAETQPPG